jgi:hypothetical protein
MGQLGLIAMECVGCDSAAVTKWPDLTAQGYRRFRCRDCDKQFNQRSDGVLDATLARAGMLTKLSQGPRPLVPTVSGDRSRREPHRQDAERDP